MNIDYTKLGFRWKGLYNQYINYAHRDVVYKEGAAFYYDTSDASFKLFARGQIEATNQGDLIIQGVTLNQAFEDEKLYVTNGSIQFRHPIDRNGTRCIGLSQRSPNHMGWTPHSDFYMSMFYVMADGSVRSRGYDLNGKLGVTSTNDQGHGYYIPTQVNFPKGTPPIVKCYNTNRATFFLDREGQLWGVGQGTMLGVGASQSDTALPVNISENSEIGNNKIVDFFFGEFWRYDASQFFAKDENGRIYTWGYNYGDSTYRLSGLGVLTDEERFTAKLIPLTADEPISKCATDGIQSAFMITETGDLYCTGASNNGVNMLGHPVTHWTKNTQVQGPVKEVSSQAAMGSNSTNYYSSHVLLQDGRLWYRATGYQNAGVGTPQINNFNLLQDDSYLGGENLSRVFLISGYQPYILAQKTNGDWLYRGANGYSISPTGANIAPTSAADWDQAAYTMNTTYFNSQITKTICFGESIYESMGFLNGTTNKLIVIGLNNEGMRGIGHENNGQVGAIADAAPYNNLDIYKNDYVLLNQNIVDFCFAGRSRHTGSGGTSELYGTTQILTDLGDVFACGDSYYALNNEWPQAITSTPQRVLF